MAVAVQFDALVTVTVYVVVDDGLTVIDAVVAVVLQLYDAPPDAVSVTLSPLQMVCEVGLICAVGTAFTFTVPAAVAVQLAALVTVTV